MGAKYGHLSARRAVHDCPASSSRPIEAPDRGSSGSLAIEHLSRAEAQQRQTGRLQAELRPGADPRPALERLAPGTRRRAAQLVLGRLKHGWSPEQIAGRLKQQKAAVTISHESIYRFIYAQIRRTNDGAWRNYLPRRKHKRGGLGQRKRSSDDLIKGPCFHCFAAPVRRSAAAPSAIGKAIS